MKGLRTGLTELGPDASNKVAITDRLLDSAPLFLTGNTDAVYAIALLNLHRDGGRETGVSLLLELKAPTIANRRWY